mgnify:CR=1 FL=1
MTRTLTHDPWRKERNRLTAQFIKKLGKKPPLGLVKLYASPRLGWV